MDGVVNDQANSCWFMAHGKVDWFICYSSFEVCEEGNGERANGRKGETVRERRKKGNNSGGKVKKVGR